MILRLAALIAAGTASVWVATRAADEVELRNRAALAQAFADQGFDWIRVDTDGLVARLAGTAPDETARFRALGVAGSVLTPENIRDEMRVAEIAPPDLPDFRLEILRAGERITLLGLVPGDVSTGDLGQLVAAAVPGADVSDLTSASPEAPPDGWPASLSPVLAALRPLRDARIVLEPGRLTLTGMAPDRTSAAKIRDDLEYGLGDGMEIRFDLESPPPVLSPFTMRFRKEKDRAEFDACAAGSEDGVARLLAAGRTAGAPADTQCTLALGAPGPEWLDVAVAALDALARIGAGAVTVSDMTVSLEPAEDSDPGTVARTLSDLGAGLPDGYRLQRLSGATSGDAGMPETADFTATRPESGPVELKGPVGTADAASVIAAFARARFPAGSVDAEISPGRTVPDGWQVQILAGLDALATVDRGELSVTPDLVTLTGVTGNPELPSQLAASLAAALGSGTPLRLDVNYDPDLDPALAGPTPEECIAQVRTIQAETKITFPPGSSELDEAAREIVERIATVLGDCAGVPLEISGHTDSQGSDESNLDLSLGRAEAVVAALVSDGIPADSLTAVGYGESRPIGDNGTEDGREENRRIEFSLHDAGATPDFAEDSEAATEPGSQIDTQTTGTETAHDPD
ncbi:MAG: OmpA family protein [Rhodobacteraceae bacterium]|nr:OmpA family protein [Paracoccaceae bacterium]